MTVIAVAEQEPDLPREATEWFSRLDSAALSEDDQKRFDMWRQRSAEHEAAFRRVRALWEAPEFAAALTSDALTARMTPAAVRPVRRSRRAWIPAGAVAAGLLLLGFLYSDFPTVLWSDYHTATGEQRTVHLPDRSSIILNTHTAVTADVKGSHRRITLLSGEALFQVQPDAGRPFTVEHAGHVVRVVGTEFVVRERANGMTVTVVHGTVNVTGSAGADSIQLTAGQQISVGPNGLSPLRDIDTADATAWTKRRLVVSDMPLTEVVAEIQRYHPGYVWLWNPAIGNIHVTGIYDLADTTETLHVLADTLPIHMDHLTDGLVVLH